MSAISHTYEQMIRYLKGILSNRERHDLEKTMMRNPFDEEAFEGLNQLSAEDLEHDMASLMNRLDNRVQKTRRSTLIVFYRIAASILLLIGVGTTLYLLIDFPQKKVITQNIIKEKPAEQPETAVPSAPSLADNKHTEKRQELLDDQHKSKLDQAQEVTSIEITEAAENNDFEANEEMFIEVASPVTTDQANSSPKTQAENPKANSSHEGAKDSSGEVTLNELAVVTKRSARAKSKMEDKQLKEAEVNEALAGVAAGVQVQASSDAIKSDSLSNMTEPIPPGGSLKEYEKWIDNAIDHSLFRNHPGKYNILVNLTVHADGTVSNIGIGSNVPDIIAEEYKKIISKSALWKPAIENGSPFETSIEFRIVLMVE